MAKKRKPVHDGNIPNQAIKEAYDKALKTKRCPNLDRAQDRRNKI